MKSFIAFCIVLANLVLAGCGASEIANATLVNERDQWTEWQYVEFVITAEQTPKLDTVVFNDGACETVILFKHRKYGRIGAVMPKTQVFRAYPKNCRTSGGIYKAALVAEDGTSWEYKFQ